MTVKIAYHTCSNIHEVLTTLGYSAGTQTQPRTAFCNEMLREMRYLILDCDVNIHSYCEHLRRRSYTNSIRSIDSNIYDILRAFYGQYSTQQNALESGNINPNVPIRTQCPACVHSIHKTATLTVDGNFSCKCKENQCKNPRDSFWKNGNHFT